MHYTFFMHVLQSARYLMNVFPDFLLREGDILLDCLLDDKFQIAFFGPLDCDEKLIQFIVDEPVEVLDDVRMV